MIQKGTYLNVIDNSGVKKICCIYVGKGYRKRYANIGDVIVASVKSLRFKVNLKLKKGSIIKAVVVRNKLFSSLKKTTLPIRYTENAAVILNIKKKFLGTKIFGAICKDIRYTKYSKLLSLSSGSLS